MIDKRMSCECITIQTVVVQVSNEGKADSAWAVRGIPEAVRREVAAKAKSEGRTVGAWVTDALKRALDGDAIGEQVAELRRRVETLERRSDTL